MEKLFEVVTKYSYEELLNMNKFYLYKKKKAGTIFTIACTVMIFLCAILLLIMKNYTWGVFYLILALVVSILFFRFPTILANRTKKKNNVYNKEVVTDFYQEYIENIDNGEVSTISYDHILNIYETNTNFYILVGKSSVYIVSKKEIKIGSVDKLRNFLEKKLKNKFVAKF